MKCISITKYMLVLSILFSLSCCSNSDTSMVEQKENTEMTTSEEAQDPKPDPEPEPVAETEEATSAPLNSVVAEYGQLSVSGNYMVDKSDTPVKLRGMSLFWSQWMGHFYTKEAVKWLKEDWNVTIIRASMGVISRPACLPIL